MIPVKHVEVSSGCQSEIIQQYLARNIHMKRIDHAGNGVVHRMRGIEGLVGDSACHVQRVINGILLRLVQSLGLANVDVGIILNPSPRKESVAVRRRWLSRTSTGCRTKRPVDRTIRIWVSSRPVLSKHFNGYVYVL